MLTRSRGKSTLLCVKLGTVRINTFLFFAILISLFTFSMSATRDVIAACQINNPGRVILGDPITITVAGATPNQEYTLEFQNTNLVGAGGNLVLLATKTADNDGKIEFAISAGSIAPGSYHFRVAKKDSLISECTSGRPTTIVLGNQPGVIRPPRITVKYACFPSGNRNTQGVCKQYQEKEPGFDSAQFTSEQACLASCSFTGSGNIPTRPATQPETCDGGEGLQTAIGCIPIRNTNDFVGWFLKWAIGIAGGIAFLLIIFSGFQIMTSSNNPQQLQGGRELLTAAISGLIIIIFSAFLLKLIGVDILGIPGLGQ